MARSTHIVRYFPEGIGHIEARDGRYLVTYYGRRVRQGWADSVKQGRGVLRGLVTG